MKIEPILVKCTFAIMYPFLAIYFIYLVETGQIPENIP